MTHKSISPALRRRLLLGGALAALSATVASPAFADLDASGAKVIASDQTQTNAGVSASATNPVIVATGQPTDASVAVDTNTVSATAKGNSSTSSMTPDALDLAAATGGASLSTGTDGSTAYAPALIATRQSLTGEVSAKTLGSLIGVSLGASSASSADVSGNTQQAIVLGNQEGATLALSGQAVSTGAGILSDQSIAGNAAVAVGTSARAKLTTAGDSEDSLSLGSNLQRAIGYGNSADNNLSADAVSIATSPASGAVSTVAPGTDPSVNAAYAVLSDQRLGSRIAAISTGGFDVKVRGDADSSSISNTGNSLVAAGYGNEAVNGLTLSADGIANDARFGGAVANITNVQQVAGAPVAATTTGGARVLVRGAATDTSLGVTDNAVLAVATANQTDGNSLSVTATSITAGAGTGGYGGGGGQGGGGAIANAIPGPVGTAQVDIFGTASVTAPFSVQNVQSQNGNVTATASDAASLLRVGGDVAGSSLTASGNSTSAGATANEATNGLTLAGTSIATAADLNSLQSAVGTVTASVGSATSRAGALVAGNGSVTDAALTVSGNTLATSAAGNNVGNTMTITGTSLTNDSGHSNAEAGALTSGTGAAADFALANNQQLGGNYMPGTVNASTYGGFTAITAQGASDSALTVSNNSQTASAIDNGATNALSVSATNLGSDTVLAPGSALSSSQNGFGHITATSDMALGLSSTANDSSLSLTGNSNTASAGINTATNSLTVDTVNAAVLSGQNATASGSAMSPLQVAGDEVLANSQSASGSATAHAITTGLVGDTGASLAASSFEESGNDTSATAAANSATNTLSLTAASDREASAGLADLQTSSAAVNATAISTLGYGAGAVTGAQALIENNATTADARGNDASNALTVTGGSTAQGLASITTDCLNGVSASGALLNAQSNTGAVMATSYGPTAAINAGGTSGASLGVNANTLTANAYGNSATNTVTLASLNGLPTAGIANVQTNSGPVSAIVSGATYTIAAGAANASRFALTGNTVTAQAIGNVAVNTITTAR